MIKFRKLILLNIILLLSSCGTIKEGFTNQKKSSTDEFLVEKKLPLKMPPNYEELPVPKYSKKDDIRNENKIKKMIVGEKKMSPSSENSKKNNKNFEKSLLEKIKNN
jgi:hypothetical protein